MQSMFLVCLTGRPPPSPRGAVRDGDWEASAAMAAGRHASSARSSTAPLTFVTAPRELAGAGELPWPRLSSGAPTAEDIEN
jgi:hypothetical protein